MSQRTQERDQRSELMMKMMTSRMIILLFMALRNSSTSASSSLILVYSSERRVSQLFNNPSHTKSQINTFTMKKEPSKLLKTVKNSIDSLMTRYIAHLRTNSMSFMTKQPQPFQSSSRCSRNTKRELLTTSRSITTMCKFLFRTTG